VFVLGFFNAHNADINSGNRVLSTKIFGQVQLSSGGRAKRVGGKTHSFIEII